MTIKWQNNTNLPTVKITDEIFMETLYVCVVQVAFYVGVQIDEGSKDDHRGLSPEMRQLGAVGAVKVAVRSSSMGVGSSSKS